MAILKKIGCFIFLVGSFLNSFAQKTNEQIFKGNEKYIAKEYGEALKFYNEALSKESANAVALYNLGAAHFKNGNLESAKTAFEQAISHTDSKSLQQKAWYNLGVAHVNEKNFEEGVHAFKQAVKLDPSDEAARYNLQKALLQQQKPPPPPQNQNQQKNQQNKNKQSKLDKESVEQYLKSLEEREQNIRQRMNERSKQNANRPEKDW